MRSDRALAAVAALGLAAAGAPWKPAPPDYRWSFPRDHWAHDGFRNEWWYFTGHLESVDPPGRRLGYQLTFFRVGLLPERPPLDSRWSSANLVMGHAALSDLSKGEHRFSEVLRREMPDLGGFAPFAQNPIAWSVAPAGTDGRWTLAWNGDGFDLAMADRAQGMSFRLSTAAAKPLVFHGPNGLSRKSEDGSASLYYSFTRLATRGEVTLGGERWQVIGTSWMDKELGSNQLGERQAGWDWFALQLADGRELMLYLLRRADGTVDHRSATLVGTGGDARWLAPGEWSARATASWRSPATGAVYPAGWAIELPGEGLRLGVEPELADQENRAALAGLFYWEGAVRVTDGEGRPAGSGYVELTGYGRLNRPPL